MLRTGAVTLLAVCLCLGGGGAIAVAQAAPATGGPESAPVVVAPNADLVDGDLVAVTGAGFGSEAFVRVLECVGGPFQRCYHEGTNFIQDDRGHTHSDVDGNVATHFRVHAAFADPAGDLVDCRAVTCSLLVSDVPTFTEFVEVPLAFDPDAPLRQAPTITAEPDADLVAGQSVVLHGAGWFAHEPVLVDQCVGDPTFSDCLVGGDFVDAGADGTFDLTMTLTGGVNGRTCVPSSCFIEAVADDIGPPITLAPLAFAPLPAPPAPPTVREPAFTG